ncbi:hypothetical protein QJS10_CPA09g00106 [Acorus calamus]|uniref:Transmembrane protein n=1 Tax=Acorus calamus TaxID=4465 RepID=A0AAV9E5I4_ACOCL|nr:hypothetical protein QJS10_CPA09g00106 [Acorus calamus]
MSHERLTSASTSAIENDLFVDILREAPLSIHRQHTSIVGSVLYCVLLALYAIVAAAAPWIFILIPQLISPLLCSCNVILLIITGIFQQYLVYQVRKVRLQGYYGYSQKLKHIVRLPFATIAYGEFAIIISLLHYY